MTPHPMTRLLLALLVVSVSACTQIEVQSYADPELPRVPLESFGWMPGKTLLTGPGGELEPGLEEGLKAAARAELLAKGYRFAAPEEQPDFVVAFLFGSSEKLTELSYPSTSADPQAWTRPELDSEMRRSTLEGHLAIDLFRTADRRLVWHGQAQSPVEALDPGNGALIRKAVEAIFIGFPPRATP